MNCFSIKDAHNIRRFFIVPSFVVIVIFSSVTLPTVTCQNNPTPCPEIFSYEPRGTEEDRWYGVIALTTREELDGVWIKVVLDYPAELLGNWFGEVSGSDLEFTIKNSRYRLEPGPPVSVRFFVKYNTHNYQVPSVKSIKLNGKTICSERRVEVTTPQLHLSRPKPVAVSNEGAYLSTSQEEPHDNYQSGGGNRHQSVNSDRVSVNNDRGNVNNDRTNSHQAVNNDRTNSQDRPNYGNNNDRLDTNHQNGNQDRQPNYQTVNSNNNNNQVSSTNNNRRPTVNSNSNYDNDDNNNNRRETNGRPSGSNQGNSYINNNRTPNNNNNRQSFSNSTSSFPLSSQNSNNNRDTNSQSGDLIAGQTARPHQANTQYEPDVVPSRSTQCGVVASKASPLISYGQNTTQGQWPWHVAIYHTQNAALMYTCGGTLISTQHVLTAAHCVARPQTNRPIDTDRLAMYLGKYSLKRFGTGTQDREIAEVYIHPQYNYSVYFNDIAVVRLERPIDVTNYVRPCCLWDEDNVEIEPLLNKLGTVVGWGFDEKRQISDTLMQAEMPIVSTVKCIYSNRDFFSQFTFEKTYCAGFRNDSVSGTTVCNGDSGGGMVFPRSVSSSTSSSTRQSSSSTRSGQSTGSTRSGQSTDSTRSGQSSSSTRSGQSSSSTRSGRSTDNTRSGQNSDSTRSGQSSSSTGSTGSSTVWQIRGIVSVGVALQGQGVCDPSHYIVFTDVAKHLDWIKKVMNEK